MKRRKIKEIRVSSRGNVYAQYCEYNPKMEGIYVLQILIPNGCYLRSNADIPKLSEINFICKYFKI